MTKEEFLRQECEKLCYVELKNETAPVLLDGIDLPLLKDDLTRWLQSGEKDRVEGKLFIRAMVVNMSADPYFIHHDRYGCILNELLDDREKFLISEGMRHLDEPAMAFHYFHTNYLMGSQDKINTYFYANLLREICDDPEAQREALKILNHLLRDHPDFPLAYYGLAMYEQAQGHFRKAYLYLNGVLEKLDCADLPSEIKAQLRRTVEENRDEIRLDSDLQEAGLSIESNHLDRAEQILEGMDSDHAITYYFKAKIALKRSELTKAVELLDLAYARGYRELSYYIDASYAAFMSGAHNKALEILDEGLEYYHDDAHLLYNRALILMTSHHLDDAIRDLETLVSYDDVNENIYNEAVGLLLRLKGRSE